MHRTEARMYLARLAELHAESKRTKSLLRRLRLYSEADRVVEELVTRHRASCVGFSCGAASPSAQALPVEPVCDPGGKTGDASGRLSRWRRLLL